MTHASLFSGIGGFDLAANWVGWNNIFNCEIDPFCNQILKHHFPNSINHNDITKTNFTIYKGNIDVLSGGFPCQPFSHSGKRKGSNDERYLWGEMLRAIKEIQPRWIVGENVRHFVDWEKQMVFNQVQIDLEVEGYEILPFLLPACSKNAPHKRERIFIIAHTNAPRIHQQYITTKPDQEKKHSRVSFKERIFSPFGIKPPVFRGDNGISGKLDGITFSKWRNQSIKAYGNAIVPQIAYEIFKTINEYEKEF
jgi:DNA (cytosine-5)-methyltransferase 1